MVWAFPRLDAHAHFLFRYPSNVTRSTGTFLSLKVFLFRLSPPVTPLQPSQASFKTIHTNSSHANANANRRKKWSCFDLKDNRDELEFQSGMDDGWMMVGWMDG